MPSLLRCRSSREVTVTLQLRNLVAVKALQPVTVHIAAGQSLAAVATPEHGNAVARVVVGLAAPVAGEVHVGERDVTELPPARRQIGYVPAGGALLPHLTIRQNIRYGQVRRERVHEVADAWVTTIIERLELAPTLDMRPHQLSEARRFRAALARAAAWLPEALVIDLPGATDRADRLSDLIARVSPPASPGIAVLVCTREPTVLEDIPNRVQIEAAPQPDEATR